MTIRTGDRRPFISRVRFQSSATWHRRVVHGGAHRRPRMATDPPSLPVRAVVGVDHRAPITSTDCLSRPRIDWHHDEPPGICRWKIDGHHRARFLRLDHPRCRGLPNRTAIHSCPSPLMIFESLEGIRSRVVGRDKIMPFHDPFGPCPFPRLRPRPLGSGYSMIHSSTTFRTKSRPTLGGRLS